MTQLLMPRRDVQSCKSKSSSIRFEPSFFFSSGDVDKCFDYLLESFFFANETFIFFKTFRRTILGQLSNLQILIDPLQR